MADNELPAGCRKRFDQVNIGGNAVVQLGDRYIEKQKNVSIDTAFFLLQENIDLSKLGLAQALQSSQIVPTLQAQRQRKRAVDASNHDKSIQNHSSLGCRNRPLHAPYAPSRDGIRKSPEAKEHGNTARNKIRECNEALSSQHIVLAEESSSQALCVGSNSALIHPGPQLIALLTLALSCLIGRNASTQELTAFMTRCQKDPLLPMLTALLAFGFARLLYAGQVVRNPSGFDELGITLEDAYGIREFVSMSVCADYTIFKSFLEVHYRKAGRSTGEMLVQANQFHTMFGSRRGAVIDTEAWFVRPGLVLVNSLYVRTEEAKCLLCKSGLVLGDLDGLHCYDCDLFFRDFDTIWARSAIIPYELCGAYTTSATGRPFNDVWDDDANLVQYLDETQIDLEGLKHIDIRVVPAKASVSTPRAAQSDTRELASSGPQHRQETFGDRIAAARSGEELPDDDELVADRYNNDYKSTITSEDGEHVLYEVDQVSGLMKTTFFEEKYSQQDATAMPKLSTNQENTPSEVLGGSPSISPGGQDKPKGILKPPRSTPFPEDPNPIRESVALLTQAAVDRGIPRNAKWTKIDRRLVNPEALERAGERYEEREDCVIVLRVLTKFEIQALADSTNIIREERERAQGERVRYWQKRRWKKQKSPGLWENVRQVS